MRLQHFVLLILTFHPEYCAFAACAVSDGLCALPCVSRLDMRSARPRVGFGGVALGGWQTW